MILNQVCEKIQLRVGGGGSDVLLTIPQKLMNIKYDMLGVNLRKLIDGCRKTLTVNIYAENCN